MENQNQKWVNISFLAAAVLLSYILFTFGMKLSGQFDVETKIRNIEMVLRIGSIVAGALVFFGLSRHAKASQFMNEVVAELARVTWPTQKETSSATVVVIIMVLISGVVLWLLDSVWTQMVQWIL